MLNGSLPRYPRLGFCIVDVRDVVDLHIRAMTAPQAVGERFIAASDWMWMADVAHVLRSDLGASAKKVPTRPMPDLVLRIVALFQHPMRFVVPLLGRKHVFTAAKEGGARLGAPSSGNNDHRFSPQRHRARRRLTGHGMQLSNQQQQNREV